jgi:Mce-associated membrane protein
VNAPQPPKPRRRIAGEAKPGEASVAPEAKPKLPKPKLPKRPKSEPTVATTSDLPAAPPRLDAVRIRRPKPSATVVILLVLAIGSLGFGAFGVWRGVDEWRSNSIVDARGDATDAAASAVETIYSYRYNNLDEHMRASQATMTPKFAKKLPSATRVLKKLAPLRKTQVKAVVRYAAAKECGEACSPHKATVLIFFDMASANADSEKPTVVSPRIDVSMVERNGEWLVDNIKWL